MSRDGYSNKIRPIGAATAAEPPAPLANIFGKVWPVRPRRGRAWGVRTGLA
jgi:hypothetical protein